ncbi:MAG: hypothetical protein WCJ03_03160 [Bacteroidales bacterium]
MRILAKLVTEISDENAIKGAMITSFSEHIAEKGLINVRATPCIDNRTEYRMKPLYVITLDEFDTVFSIIEKYQNNPIELARHIKELLIGGVESDDTSLNRIDKINLLCSEIEKRSSMMFGDAVEIFMNNNVPRSMEMDVYNTIVEDANKGYRKEEIDAIVHMMVKKYTTNQLYHNM